MSDGQRSGAATPPVEPGPPGGSPPVATANDLEHLRLLSIFYYVLACLQGLAACATTGLIVIGPTMIAMSKTIAEQDPDVDQGVVAGIGAVLTALIAVALAFAWGTTVLLAVTGVSLARHDRRTLCMIVACLILLSVPFGTILGVFTLVVLQRDSVRQLFAAKAAARAAGGTA